MNENMKSTIVSIAGCICLTVIGLFIINLEFKNQEIKKEIIKQSTDYTIYEECTEIQNNWYCK